MRPSGFSVASWFVDRLRLDTPKADQRQDDLREPWLGREVTRGRKGPVTHHVPGSLWTLCGTCLWWPQEK